MSDNINRQDAIDALDEWESSYSWDAWCYGHKDDAKKFHIDAPTAVIENLPSAPLEQKIGKFVRWMEKRETPNHISFTPHCKCSLCGNELLIECINYCYVCGARLIEDREAERWEE